MGQNIEYAKLINTVINVLVIPILPLVTAYIVALIKKKITEIQEKTGDLDLTKYMQIAETAIITAAASVKQMNIDAAGNSNRGMVESENQTALELAADKVKKILGDTAINNIKQLYSNVDIWLATKLQYQMSQLQIPVMHSSNTGLTVSQSVLPVTAANQLEVISRSEYSITAEGSKSVQTPPFTIASEFATARIPLK